MSRIIPILSVLALVASIVVVAIGLDDGRGFPWGTHMVTVTAVLLLGVIIGWWLREKQVADERARAEIEASRKG